MADTVRAITDAGMTVIGHIGLTPQSVGQLGCYRLQGKTAADAERLLGDAVTLQEAGAMMIVLEMVPDRVAGRISRELRIPTIGIGRGRGLRWSGAGAARHVGDLRPLHAEVRQEVRRGLLPADGGRAGRLSRDVAARRFPEAEHSFAMDDAEWEAWGLAGR